MTAFYNDNEARAYPFLDQGGVKLTRDDDVIVTLPDDVIVDFSAIMGPHVGYREHYHTTYLYTLARTGNTLTFCFRTTAEGGELTFTRELSDPEYLTSDEEDIVDPPTSLCTTVLMEGWLTTGRFTRLAALLADGQVLTAAQPADTAIEPSQVQSLYNNLVTSISVANRERVQYQLPGICPGGSDEEQNYAYKPVATCLDGDIRLASGYNCNVSQDSANNTILLTAGVGNGRGQVCNEFAIYPGETTPEDSSFYSGGPACYEACKSICGVPGPNVQFIAGPGVKIEPGAAHELVIDFTLEGMDICG